jgi:hypothetical protein
MEDAGEAVREELWLAGKADKVGKGLKAHGAGGLGD